MRNISTHRVPAAWSDHAGDRQFATTLARGMELLRCFTPEKPVLGNRDLSRLLGMPPATVARLSYTLQVMGYLEPAEGYGKLQLGSAVLSLAYPLLSQFTSLRRRARPLMVTLAEALDGTVAIGIRDRLGVVYIETVRPYGQRVYPVEIGIRHSLAGTAMGRALLMSCRPAEREALLNQLQVREPQEWAQHGERLKANLTHFAHSACCVSVGEVYPDVQAVAVPLGRIDRGEMAALNISFQGRALDEAWLREQVAPQLQAMARQLR